MWTHTVRTQLRLSLLPAQLNELILFVLKNYNDGGEISQIKPILLCTLLPSAARWWSKKEVAV
jgi:hypothetical protein